VEDIEDEGTEDEMKEPEKPKKTKKVSEDYSKVLDDHIARFNEKSRKIRDKKDQESVGSEEIEIDPGFQFFFLSQQDSKNAECRYPSFRKNILNEILQSDEHDKLGIADEVL
jgi:hypothetical protein